MCYFVTAEAYQQGKIPHNPFPGAKAGDGPPGVGPPQRAMVPPPANYGPPGGPPRPMGPGGPGIGGPPPLMGPPPPGMMMGPRPGGPSKLRCHQRLSVRTHILNSTDKECDKTVLEFQLYC